MTTIVSAVEDRTSFRVALNTHQVPLRLHTITGISEAASSAMSGVLTWGAKTAAHWAYDEVRQVMRDYPPVAALILSFGALAIVPVTMFTFFSISSFFGLTGIALLVVAALEGVLLLVGGALLAPILMVCLAMAVVITGGLGLTWGMHHVKSEECSKCIMHELMHR